MPSNQFLAQTQESIDLSNAGLAAENGKSDFLLAAVYSVNQDSSAVTLLIDGTGTPTQKYYKALTGAWPLQPDDRVIVLKMSGTYVVVGKIGAQSVTPTPTFIAPPNTVFAGPASGDSSDEATFRALTPADIPGGGDETIIVTTGIITPNTGVTIETQKLAYSGKRAALYFRYKTGDNLNYNYNSKLLGTISAAYRPAVNVRVVAESFNAHNSSSGRTNALIQIGDDGKTTHCGSAGYNDSLECYVEYMLP